MHRNAKRLETQLQGCYHRGYAAKDQGDKQEAGSSVLSQPCDSLDHGCFEVVERSVYVRMRQKLPCPTQRVGNASTQPAVKDDGNAYGVSCHQNGKDDRSCHHLAEDESIAEYYVQQAQRNQR